MIIERTKKEVIIKLPSTTNIDTLQDVMDWIEFKELSKKAKATQKQIDNLVKEIKKGRWSKTKALLSK
ncbi:MAG TPA: hypothetical protein PKM51_02940 [Chitinophagales bacterium]|nr:hypothetical protein [Chitinophagales bacterium]HNM31682.1 hypothetical protein [Chitinophagales bacterium]